MSQPSLFDSPDDLRRVIPSERALEFRVLGVPVTQGSGQAMVNRFSGRAVIVPDHEAALLSWRTNVGQCALAARAGRGLAGVLLDGPVRLVLVFRLPRRKAWRRATKLEFVSKRPDFDKLTRAVADALTDVAYLDDGQITTALILKRPSRPGEPACLDVAVGPDADAGLE